MIKFTLIFIFLLFSNIGESRDTQKCFYKHIKDAIEINKVRKNPYIKLSNGLSKKTSNGLINFEKLIIPFSKYFDKKAKRWQKQGIPFLCEDLIDMNEIPEFSHGNNYPLEEDFTPLPVKKWTKVILSLIRKNKTKKLQSELLEQLAVVNRYPNSHCLTRHFVESIARTAFLWPGYVEQTRTLKEARQLNKLIKRYLFTQALTLPYVLGLDKKAFPTQKMGVPILCQDVPHIPLP